MVLERIDFETEKPTEDGIYLIETVSTINLPITRRHNRFESHLKIIVKPDETKYSWGISNQKVVAWFRETNQH